MNIISIIILVLFAFSMYWFLTCTYKYLKMCKDESIDGMRKMIIPMCIFLCLICILPIIYVTYNKSIQPIEIQTESEISTEPPDRKSYTKYDYSHWGDCFSLTKKEGWVTLTDTVYYDNLEKDKTYKMHILVGKVLGQNDGINVDEMTIEFTPHDTKGSIEYTFYGNPEWIDTNYIYRLDCLCITD